MDKLYVDKINGRFEAWSFSDGERVSFKTVDFFRIERYARRFQLQIIEVWETE